MTTLHGIPNCDTMKKARAWLDAHAIPYAFHDYRKAGIAADTLAAWAARAGWEKLLNRSGTTFRRLPPEDTANLTEARALALMAARLSMIRRPVLAHGDTLEIGFDPARYAAIFGR